MISSPILRIDYTLSSQLQPTQAFSEKRIIHPLNLTTKASSIRFDDSCQSQINFNEVKRKNPKEIVTISTDLTEDDSRMRVLLTIGCIFSSYRIQSQPIRTSSGCYGDDSSLSHR